MSAVAQRMARPDAIEIAKAFVAEIEPYTDQLIVAGSLRRRLAYVGDIEICAVPKVDTVPIGGPDLFGDVRLGGVDMLDLRLTMLLDKGRVQKRETNGKTAWGPKHKRLLFQGAPIDLFCAVNDWNKEPAKAEPERFGLILTIRTGPAQYSHQLVTEAGKTAVVGKRPGGRPITRVGLLPSHLRVQGGWLTSRVSGIRIPTPTEQDFYEMTRLRWLDPWERV
jgi:hypothetical protein